MRGVVSLAASLALPRAFEDGTPLPERDLILFLTFCVVLSTLVLQGLSLPFIARKLRVKQRPDEKHERDTRLKLAHAAVAHLNKLGEQKTAHEQALQRVTAIYQERIRHLTDSIAEVLGWSTEREQLIATRRMLLDALAAERRELIKLRRDYQVDEELMRRIQYEMDLEELRLQSQ
jgi:CPA1 family monovalent cation:H+ antiporter